MRHGLQALRDTLQQDKELNIQNTSLGIVGKDKSFEIIEGEALQKYLDLLGDDVGRTRRGGDTSMDTSDQPSSSTSGQDDVVAMDTDNWMDHV